MKFVIGLSLVVLAASACRPRSDSAELAAPGGAGGELAACGNTAEELSKGLKERRPGSVGTLGSLLELGRTDGELGKAARLTGYAVGQDTTVTAIAGADTIEGAKDVTLSQVTASLDGRISQADVEYVLKALTEQGANAGTVSAGAALLKSETQANPQVGAEIARIASILNAIDPNGFKDLDPAVKALLDANSGDGIVKEMNSLAAGKKVASPVMVGGLVALIGEGSVTTDQDLMARLGKAGVKIDTVLLNRKGTESVARLTELNKEAGRIARRAVEVRKR